MKLRTAGRCRAPISFGAGPSLRTIFVDKITSAYCRYSDSLNHAAYECTTAPRRCARTIARPPGARGHRPQRRAGARSQRLASRTGSNMTHGRRTTKCFRPRSASLAFEPDVWGAKVWRICINASALGQGRGPVGSAEYEKKKGEDAGRSPASAAATPPARYESGECRSGRSQRARRVKRCANCDRGTAAAAQEVPRCSSSAGAEREPTPVPRCSGRYRRGSTPRAYRRCRPHAPTFALRR